jgi:alpha,alpha-trehalase
MSLQNQHSRSIAREPSPESLVTPPSPATARPESPGILSATTSTARLAFEVLMALDLDGDGRLTDHDAGRARESGLRFAVDLELGPGARLELAGAERLSHAADILAEEILEGRGEDPGLPVERMLEPRTDTLRRLIDRGWEGLVRRSDRAEDLKKALQVMPVKDPEGRQRVYVPARDRKALKKLRADARRSGDLEVVPLQKPRDARDWETLMRQPGMLYLPRPYIVPGGRFVQMFGWDSYFNARGALASGQYELARDLLENQIYEIEHYGKIPNSNLSYHLSRTQPPLMPRLALELHAVRPDRRLLKRVARAAEQELEKVFRTGARATPSGLSRYKDDAEGPDAEDLSAFYSSSRPDDAGFHRHDRAIRESGWDMCHRFGTATHHHEPVCLNSLLFQYEMDLAWILREVEGEDSLKAARYAKAARARVRTMRARFWDAERGLFFDHDFVAGRRSRYECLATFYPLWTGWASREEAATVAAALPRFLHDGGLTASSRASREAAGGEDLQWDWPFGWAPHQIIAVEGLRRYGFHAEADAVAYRWLSMVLDIAGSHNGLIREKYDVVGRSAEVAVEYGNQGADRGTPLAPRSERTLGFAWTNASVVLLLDGLSPGLREALDAGIPADRVLGPRDQGGRGRSRKKRGARIAA